MPIEDRIDSPLAAAVRKAGTQSAFARLIGKPQSTVHGWLTQDKPLAVEHLDVVDRELGIPPEVMRPDLAHLFPKADTQSPGARPSEAPAASSPDEAAGVRRPSDPLEGLRS